LARQPLKYLFRLPDGEPYGFVRLKDLPREEPKPDAVGRLPLLIPEQQPRKGGNWYVFGAFGGKDPAEENCKLPVRPQDPLAAYGAIPGEPEVLAKRYTLSAYTMEIGGGLFLLTGIGMNILFITMIIYLLL
jgi:hypothetical protein